MLLSNYKKRGLGIVIILIITIFVLSFSVNAVGISIQSQGLAHEFEPGLEFTVRAAALYPTMDSFVNLSAGEFSDYVTLSRTQIPLDDPDKSFTIHFKLPSNIDVNDFTPGTNKIWIKVSNDFSNIEEVGGFRFSASGAAYLSIFVPYPGFYLETESLSVLPVNAGENSALVFTMWNRGNNDLINTYYEFNIKDQSGNILLEKSGQNIAISSQEKKNFDIPISTYLFNPGYYNATLNYFYLDEIVTKNTVFKVGNLNVDIVNVTNVLFNDSIQQFDIEVQSDWNEVITNVYAAVSLNGTESKTSPVDLSNFETKVLTTYIDPSGFPSDNYSLDITLFYSDEEKHESVNIELLERLIEEPDKEPVNVVLVVLIVVIVLLLVIMGLFILFYMKRRRKEKGMVGNGKKKQ